MPKSVSGRIRIFPSLFFVERKEQGQYIVGQFSTVDGSKLDLINVTKESGLHGQFQVRKFDYRPKTLTGYNVYRFMLQIEFMESQDSLCLLFHYDCVKARLISNV